VVCHFSFSPFSRTDSNLLALGGCCGEIKLWNVKEQACDQSFDSRNGAVQALFFAGGADCACMPATNAGSVIWSWRAEGSSDFASETIVNGTHSKGTAMCGAFTPSGSILANSSGLTLALHELETMTKTGSVVLPGVNPACFAMSPDSKQLVVGDDTRGGQSVLLKPMILPFKHVFIEEEDRQIRKLSPSHKTLLAESLPSVTVMGHLSFGLCKW
jgi:WD40 repeat protein